MSIAVIKFFESVLPQEPWPLGSFLHRRSLTSMRDHICGSCECFSFTIVLLLGQIVWDNCVSDGGVSVVPACCEKLRDSSEMFFVLGFCFCCR